MGYAKVGELKSVQPTLHGPPPRRPKAAGPRAAHPPKVKPELVTDAHVANSV